MAEEVYKVISSGISSKDCLINVPCHKFTLEGFLMKPHLSKEQKHRHKEFKERAVKLAKHLLGSDREMLALVRSKSSCASQIAEGFGSRGRLVPAARGFFSGFGPEGPLPSSPRHSDIADYVLKLDSHEKMVVALDAFIPAIITSGSDAVVMEMIGKMEHKQAKVAMRTLKRAQPRIEAGVFAAMLDCARTEVDTPSFARIVRTVNRKVMVPLSQSLPFPESLPLQVREKIRELKVDELERMRIGAEGCSSALSGISQ